MSSASKRVLSILGSLLGLNRSSELTMPSGSSERAAPLLVLKGSDGKPYPALSAILERFGSEAAAVPEILMFGDSVAERVANQDADRRTLAEMVEEKVKPRAFLALTRSAHNAVIYEGLLKALEKQARKPRIIILPINLRSFSPQWHLNPNWQLEQEQKILCDYLQQGSAALAPVADVYADMTLHEAYEKIPVHYELSACRTIGEFQSISRNHDEALQERRLRELFIFHYTHRLETTHPKFVALRNAVALARQLADQLILYITPINMQSATRHVGPAFQAIVRDNVATLKAGLETELLDWSDAFGEELFFHKNELTEHLNAQGREQLAQMLGQKCNLKP